MKHNIPEFRNNGIHTHPAIGRWRQRLRGIAIEEMLHMALVANLTAAIGDQAIDHHFLFLERPEGGAVRRRRGRSA